MATHSSILSWKIPWTEDTSKLQPMGCEASDMTEQLSAVMREGGMSFQGLDSCIVRHIYVPFQVLFPYKLLRSVEKGSLCYAVGPCR